jgi:hypothetical protein
LVEKSLISTLPASPYAEEEYSTESDESYLYLHAPQHLSRDESFAYHVTTRNFFAWLMGAPIVGYDPVSALLSLKDRMDIWRDEGSDNLKAICDYIQDQGYGDVSQFKAQLPPTPKPTMYRDRSSRFSGIPRLTNVTKRSGSVAAPRQSLRRKMRFSENFTHRPHIADPIRSHQEDNLSRRKPLREGDLATIAYKDTSPGTPPSLTAWRPKPKISRSIALNTNYTEIVVPDYGNGLHNPTIPLETTSITSASNFDSTPLIPSTSPSDAYTCRPLQASSSDNDTPPSPSSSSTTSSPQSYVPSLSSTYSTEESDSPPLASPALASPVPPSYTFTSENKETKRESAHDEEVKIMMTGSEPDLIIDALIGELEAAGLGGRPKYEALGMEKYLARTFPGERERDVGLGLGLA